MASITAQDLRQRWLSRQEVALVDVREEGPYSLGHPLFAVTVPISEIEEKLPLLVPRLSAPVVVYDDGEGYAERAVTRIRALGYSQVVILEGGLSAYARVGEIYRDVNVPSKAFGELVEAIRQTPSLPARDVQAVLDSSPNVVVLDARRLEEYSTMTIPHSRSCPGGELLYRLFAAAPSSDTTVIVHCAGRTRSILGTQTLINAAVPHRVVALRNGTIGWTLDGLELETKKTERVPPPSADALQKARAHSASWAQHVGVAVIDADRLAQLVAEADTWTLYLLDVRDPEEYALGHLPGFRSAPGGQLVQATDEWVAVRGARLVLHDTDGVRAPMTASWLLQMGWDVYVLDASAVPALPSPVYTPAMSIPPVGAITVEALSTLAGATVVDLARSPVYRRGHIPGAWFASGPALARDLQTLTGDGPLVLTSPDGLVAAANAADARSAVSRDVRYLQGGTAAWVAAGQPLETDSRFLSPPSDVYKRPYEGTNNGPDAMQAYIDWEHQLIAQLANDGVAGFHVAKDRRS